MEMLVARSFHGLGILIFFLYFMKVSSAPSASTTQTITDVMKSDKVMCQLPNFFYENNVTRNCQNARYPEGNLTLEIRIGTLCLAFYDTMYKVCQTNQLKTFDNENAFYSHIHKFFPGEKKNEQDMFCENIKGVKISYKKLKPLLSAVNFNNSFMCNFACFDNSRKFNPLCAILSWSKSIDNVTQTNKNQQKQLQVDTVDKKVTAESQQKKVEVIKPEVSNVSNEAIGASSDNNTKKVKGDVINNNNEIQTNSKPVGDKNAGIVPSTQDNLPLIKTKPSKAKIADVNVKQNIVSNANSAVSDKEKEVETNDKADHTSDNLEKPSIIDDKPEDTKKLEETNANSANNANNGADVNNNVANVNNNVANVNNNVANADIKTTIISENTQDYENSANQDNWSHAQEEKLPNDLNEEPDLPIATGDQGQSIPEPSEQREIIPHYHSIRTDEESHFFTYFTIVSLISVAAYIGYHNKQKILAIVLEGRRSRNNRGRRRPSTANYRKLDCTLEEAVTSQCNANVTHVIY